MASGQTGEKINVTLDMHSVMGGLHQNLGAASSRCMMRKDILAHDENRNFGAKPLEVISTKYIQSTPNYLHNSMETKMHVVPSRPVPEADCFVDNRHPILTNKPRLPIYLMLCLPKQYKMGIRKNGTDMA